MTGRPVSWAGARDAKAPAAATHASIKITHRRPIAHASFPAKSSERLIAADAGGSKSCGRRAPRAGGRLAIGNDDPSTRGIGNAYVKGMEIHQLEYLTAVAEEGSISKAACRVGVAQPSLSQQVKKLEDELGHRLLDRLPKGVVPTEA